MRPCHQCRSPIENRDAVCPHCGAATSTGPKVNPSGPVPLRGYFSQLMHDLNDVTSPYIAPLWVTVFVLIHAWLALPLLAGGFLGFLIGGDVGALVGVIGAMVLFVAVVVWRDHRRGL